MEATTYAPHLELNSSLAKLPATRQHWTRAIVVWIILLLALVVAAPFADRPLPRFDSFMAITMVLLATTNFLTAYLLFSEFSLFGDTAILPLAGGYLMAALLCIPQALSYPANIMQIDLLGGLQTAPWLYFFWHVSFAIAVIIYALLKDMPCGQKAIGQRPVLPITSTVIAVVGLAAIVIWICIEAERFLPEIYQDEILRRPSIIYYAALISFFAIVGVIALWVRRRSVLDVWLLVALSAEVGEPVLAAVLTSSRFTLGFYSSRFFSVVTSTVVLAALLSGIMTLHRRLALSNGLLERERHSKMMNIEAVTALIAHEVRQPLAAIAANGSAVLMLIEKPNPDFAEIREAVDAVVQDSLGANQVLANVRSMFRTDREPEPYDINDIIRTAVRILQVEMTAHAIELYTELSPDVPQITGYKSQIQEVVLNLLNNAIEAMAGGLERPRVLRLGTAKQRGGQACIVIDDAGPGIQPDKMATVFETFVTTKVHGRGLGLAICRMIVDRHGGRISVSASELGGARFTVILPTNHEFI